MQSQLAFRAITADEATQQQARFSAELARAAAEAPLKPPQPVKRPVGRPKRPAPLIPTAETQAEAVKRGKYTNWFSSAYIRDILHAYRVEGFSAKRAVAALQRLAPDDRYSRLHHSTVRAWFGADRELLLPHFQAQLDASCAAARGRGFPAAFAQHPEVEEEIKSALRALRHSGIAVNASIIRWVVLGVLQLRAPAILEHFKVSSAWISRWARQEMKWRWRKSTTAASKLPLDWEERGVQMAKRIAAQMEMYSVHPSLVVNVDQTAVHLVPALRWTYEEKNAKAVAVTGEDDKRQITACLASSLYGDMLPLQLIFQGKTQRCEPSPTAQSIAAQVHITHSANHWSNVETMKQWVESVLIQYAERCIRMFGLRADAHMILVLDVWAVHTSDEFRLWMRQKQPRIHLVYVPANCTSKLQVADVTLQRPFKSCIRQQFNEWAAATVKSMLIDGTAEQERCSELAESFKMASIKPRVVQWCVDSWQRLCAEKSFIAQGWYKCCISLFDVNNPQMRKNALAAVARNELDAHAVPEGREDDPGSDSDESESDVELNDDELPEDELDLTKPVRQGERRSTRQRTSANIGSYMFNSQQIALTEDSEA